MGVKGLQGFVDHACPQASMWVNLKEMAKQHQHSHPESPPVLVVDAMGCLRFWYTPEAWVHGGQWREYMQSLNTFVDAFSAIDIRLVFFFDGVIEQKKRHEWIKRRLRNNTEIANIFQYIKANGCQPGRNMFYIPSGLATFTRFALKSMGLDTISSLKEADYEIANYARENGCMAILGQDTDFLIYDTVPYISVSKLQLGKLTTVMYSRESLCRILCLQQTDLPLLACLLSNDVVPEQAVQGLKHRCLARYLPSDSRARQRKEVVAAVAHYISGISRSHDGLKEVESNIQHASSESLLEVGVRSYLLTGQYSPWLPKSGTPPGADQHENATGPAQSILQFAKEKHIKAESSTVYKILNAREVDCSNTLEDELDTELPGQAIVYRPARQSIYGILLTERNGQSGAAKPCPTSYQASQICQEDLDAYLAQALCIRDKSADHLAQIQVPCVDSRAVHLASLFVRGLSVLVSANSACGFPFKMVDLMPWEVFDGKLFHTKYLQSHNGCTMEDLLEKKDVLLQEFQKLKSLIDSICVRKNRSIQSNPQPWVTENWERSGPRDRGGSHHMAQCEQRPHTSPFLSHHQGYQGRYPQPGPANRAQTGRGSRPGRYNRRPQLYPR
ncbi:hypothetical protein scyTo_0008393 [Scyliorhinus torazame]|uniref:Uncharacterized protein n=1 Tax=Scyliorhinus torazame TaxID=75743 RepID=A0A401P8S6_SCYTO|nr:hypothetical protein [Scyliorhinus torazame]